jgi:hypothetical protein
MALTREWRKLLFWERVCWVTFPTAALAALGAVLLPAWSYQYDVALYVLLVVGGLAAVALVRAVSFRCPRCGKLYSVRVGPSPFPGRKASSRNCLNCWLPKWADPDEEPEDEPDETRNDDW